MPNKIRILFLASSPTDLGRIGLDREYREIQQKLYTGSARDSFELISHWALRPEDLQWALLREQPHIVHFCGHGSPEEEIQLMNESKISVPVSKETLAKLFRILRDEIRVVVLNCCFSKAQAEALNPVIDYTIGTSKEIGDVAAISFAAAFYQGLAFERSVKDACDLGNNLIEMRRGEGAEVLEMMVREGVDANESFLKQQQRLRPDYTQDLQMALKQIREGTATESQLEELRQAVIGGRIILNTDEIGVTGSVGQSPAVRVTPHQSFIDVQADTRSFQDLHERLYPSPEGFIPLTTKLVFVGRAKPLYDLKDRLEIRQVETSKNRQTVIHGWPGVGKTSLVGVLIRDHEVQRAFPDGILWTSLYFGENKVSPTEQEHKLLSQLASWGRVLKTDSILRAPTLNDATAQMAALLSRKRMLLVVDDVWEEGHAVPFLRASGDNCAVLITTRLPKVANYLAPGEGEPYHLRELTEEHAYRLLRLLAERIVDRHPDECRELIRDLEYLPLAIHVVAGQLKAEEKLGLDVADLIVSLREGAGMLAQKAPLDRSENGATPTLAALLRRSTDGLDEHTRECFAFLGAFAPKPATFDLEAMAAVWDVTDPKPIVRTLAGHGLLEPVGKGRFQMHALLVQHARSLLEE